MSKVKTAISINKLIKELNNDPIQFVTDKDIKILEKVIEYSADKYYNDQPVISDEIYDFLIDILKDLEPENLILKKVGAKIIKTKDNVWNFLIHDCLCYNGTSFMDCSHKLRYACGIDFILKRYNPKETDCLNIKTNEWEIIPAEAGDIIAIEGNTIHSSTLNTSENIRALYACVYSTHPIGNFQKGYYNIKFYFK
jgi:hypothetical protein